MVDCQEVFRSNKRNVPASQDVTVTLAPACTRVVCCGACEPRYAGRYSIRGSSPGPRRTALVVQAARAHTRNNQPYFVGR